MTIEQSIAIQGFIIHFLPQFVNVGNGPHRAGVQLLEKATSTPEGTPARHVSGDTTIFST